MLGSRNQLAKTDNQASLEPQDNKMVKIRKNFYLN
jgi:hypothetical protein